MKALNFVSLATMAFFCLLLLLCTIVAQVNADQPIEDGTVLQLWSCSNTFRQVWMKGANNDETIRLRYNNTYCIDINQYSVTAGGNAQVWQCHTSDKAPNHQNQEFIWRSDGTLYNPEAKMCLTAFPFSVYNGTSILIEPCDAANAKNQQFNFNPTSGAITLKAYPNLCLDAGSAYGGPCTPNNPSYKLPYCNYSLPYQVRIKDLVSRLTIQEKAGLFGYVASGVPRLGIPGYIWWSEALHGVAGSPGVSFTGSTPYATSFPQVCLTGSTFNKSLPFHIGHAIGLEGRAMNNVGHAGLTFWAPNINMFRDPRWGRGQETPGEDPVRTSFYVSEFARGFQGGSDPGHLKASTCCKHYDAYSLENWGGVQRYSFNAIVTEQDLADTYLPAFEACANRGQSSGVMCSYNAVNGVPSCANTLLLTDYLRNEYGFQGYITSDCGAVGNVLYNHNYTHSIPQTMQTVLSAGMDIDCGSMLQNNLVQYQNQVSQMYIDRALTNLFMVQFRLGIFDPVEVQPYKKIPVSVVNSREHQQLALDAARQGIVLLKNEGRYTLPLDRSKIKTVAVLGPNAAATTTMQGNYYGNAPYLISPVKGIETYANVRYVQGCDINSGDTSGFAAACAAVRSSDATVLVVGIDQSIEAEGHDRNHIAFPGVQSSFITQMAECSVNKPFVVVVMSGGPLDLTEPKSNPRINSMMWVGYPGQSGGTAIADVLFGAYNPGGRLCSTVYKADYIDQISMFDMNMRPNATTKSPGRSYRFYTGEPVYEFGYGLSYTTFLYRFTAEKKDVDDRAGQVAIRLADVKSKVKENAEVGNFNINVKNIGSRAGSDVVLAFVSGQNAGRDGNPIKSLADFERIYLEPGQNKTVVLALRARDLTTVGQDGKRIIETGVWTLAVGDQTMKVKVADY